MMFKSPVHQCTVPGPVAGDALHLRATSDQQGLRSVVKRPPKKPRVSNSTEREARRWGLGLRLPGAAALAKAGSQEAVFRCEGASVKGTFNAYLVVPVT